MSDFDEELVKKFGKIYELVKKIEKDEDYEVNQVQMDKLVRLYDFFIGKVNWDIDPDAYVEPLKFSPREVVGDVVAYFVVFSLSGNEVQKFCQVLSACSAFGIDGLEDGRVCIACTVPDVFVKRTHKPN